MDRNGLLENYMNKEYLKNHKKEYSELISNEFYSETRFIKNPNLIFERFDVFILIMNMIKNGDLDRLRCSVRPMTLEFLELKKQLGILEDQMFRE